MDLKDAYRIVPIHPHDHQLLGISRRGEIYINHFLPFGLRSAPKIFTADVDALAWAFCDRGIQHQLHYLDDFLFLGRPGSAEVSHCLSDVLKLLRDLGFPVALHEIKGPSTTVTFLGIVIDTQLLQLRLPAEKLHRL